MSFNNSFYLDGVRLWITFYSFFLKQPIMKLTYFYSQKIKKDIYFLCLLSVLTEQEAYPTSKAAMASGPYLWDPFPS